MLNNVEQIMTGKRKPPIGFRLYDDEEERLNTLLAEVRQRNRSMDRSKLLREAIGFDPRTNLTDSDLSFLRTGKREASPAIYSILQGRSASEIAAETGINIITVVKVMAEQLEGIDPQDVEIIQTALKEKPGSDNISPLRIKNGR
jgi:hypothetical protein